MGVQVLVDWNRLIVGLLVIGVVMVGLVLLATVGSPPEEDYRRRLSAATPPRVPPPTSPEVVPAASKPVPQPIEPSGPPTLRWNYTDPLWDILPGRPEVADAVAVKVLDGPQPDEIRTRRVSPNKRWMIVPVTCTYKGVPFPLELVLDFVNHPPLLDEGHLYDIDIAFKPPRFPGAFDRFPPHRRHEDVDSFLEHRFRLSLRLYRNINFYLSCFPPEIDHLGA